MPIEIPVFHLNAQGDRLAPSEVSAQDFCRSHPCVEIGFLYDPDLWHGTSRGVKAKKIIALLDTGADVVFVDQSLVEHFDCPPARGGQNMSINGEKSQPAREGQLFIIEANHCLNLWVAPKDFSSTNVPYRMILGRRFLQMCDFSWHGPKREARLVWHGAAAGAW